VYQDDLPDSAFQHPTYCKKVLIIVLTCKGCQDNCLDIAFYAHHYVSLLSLSKVFSPVLERLILLVEGTKAMCETYTFTPTNNVSPVFPSKKKVFLHVFRRLRSKAFSNKEYQDSDWLGNKWGPSYQGFPLKNPNVAAAGGSMLWHLKK